MNLMRNLLLLAGLLSALLAYSTDYYVSPGGNDSNNGTSQGTAWKTIWRVNQSTFSFNPGDRVLFERGGVWRGEIVLGNSGTVSQQITLGAYGSGAKPLIKGSELVSEWSVYQGHIWRASANTLT